MLASLFAIVLITVADPAAQPPVVRPGESPVALAFSPDGTTLAVASGESLKLYDSATGAEMLALSGHDWPVRDVAFSPNGEMLASAAGGYRRGERGGEVRLWNSRTGTPKHELTWWPECDAEAIAFSPDGKRLAAGGLRGVRMWDAATGRLEKEIETSAAVLALVYSPDGRTLAAGAFTQYVHLWDTATWKENVLKGHKSEVRAVAYSRDGNTLVTGGVGELRIWDALSDELRKAVPRSGTVWAVAYSPDDKLVAIGSGEPRTDLKGAVELWDPTDWSVKRRWREDGGGIVSVAFSPDGKVLAAGRYSGVADFRIPETR